MADTNLRAESVRDNSTRAEWYALLSQLRRIEAKPTEGRSDDELEADGDLAAAILGRLLAAPAPDNAALVWKFDYLLGLNETDLDSTPAWSKAYVMQAIVDLHCYMGDAA